MPVNTFILKDNKQGETAYCVRMSLSSNLTKAKVSIGNAVVPGAERLVARFDSWSFADETNGALTLADLVSLDEQIPIDVDFV